MNNLPGSESSFVRVGPSQVEVDLVEGGLGEGLGTSRTGAALRRGEHWGSAPGVCVTASAMREHRQNADTCTKMQQAAFLHFRGNMLESLAEGWLRGLDLNQRPLGYEIKYLRLSQTFCGTHSKPETP